MAKNVDQVSKDTLRELEITAAIADILETAQEIDDAQSTQFSNDQAQSFSNLYGPLLIALEIRALTVQVKRIADILEDR